MKADPIRLMTHKGFLVVTGLGLTLRESSPTYAPCTLKNKMQEGSNFILECLRRKNNYFRMTDSDF